MFISYPVIAGMDPKDFAALSRLLLEIVQTFDAIFKILEIELPRMAKYARIAWTWVFGPVSLDAATQTDTADTPAQDAAADTHTPAQDEKTTI